MVIFIFPFLIYLKNLSHLCTILGAIRVHDTCVEVRDQLVNAGSLSHGSQGWAQVIRWGNTCFYPLSHHADLLLSL